MEMQARHRNFILRTPETQLHAALVRLDGVDGLDAEENQNDENNDRNRAAVEAARQDIPETVLAAPDDLFQIGRAAITAATAARPVRPLPPWAATAALVVSATAAAPRAAAAILIAPGHQYLFIKASPDSVRKRLLACGGNIDPL
ncbi:hypothetical protein D3C80_1683860 [compost metagenome]